MDLNTITEIVGISNGGLTALDKADGFFQKVRDRLSGKSANDTELRLLVADLAEQLMKARVAQMQVSHRLDEFEREAKAADSFEKLLARYTTVSLPGGGIVLQLKADYVGTEPPHSICPRCVENRQRHFLQPHGRLLHCPNCETSFENAVRHGGAQSVPINKSIR